LQTIKAKVFLSAIEEGELAKLRKVYRKSFAVANEKVLGGLSFQELRTMQIKVYVPKMIEVPSEYLPALARRASESLGDRAQDVSATRGHLVRQAVQDGLLREFDTLIGEDGTVDLVCDPGLEIPLEIENHTISLAELLDALQYKQALTDIGPTAEAA
jgi:hypothetical protein